MPKAIKSTFKMPKTGCREYAFTFLSLIVPGLSKRLEKYDQINKETRLHHIETEVQAKQALAKADAMIAKQEKKKFSSDSSFSP